jgi:hypothetical protein
VNFLFGGILCDRLTDGLIGRTVTKGRRPLSEQISRLLDLFGPSIGLDQQ